MKNKTLLIMAAGMGSRFGGLKQIEPVGPNGEFIIDYSIYDAKKAGFNKVVFIIKEENYQIFKETIGKRVEQQIPVYYAFQKNDNLPNGFKNKEDRVKPWGTAHAILSAKDLIDENFAVINSDDFYGYDAYRVVSEFLDKIDEDDSTYSLVGYKVGNTLTENGAVKRGVCVYNKNNIEDIIESSIIKNNNIITSSPLDNRHSFNLEENHPVSMNMFGFTKTIFPYLEEKLIKFLNTNQDNLSTCEFLIPEVVSDAIKEKYAIVKLLQTTAHWMGVTYKEDKEKLVAEINKLIEEGTYPNKLF